MQSKVEVNKVAINLWTARIIPVFLAGVVGYATYVIVALLCGKAVCESLAPLADFLLQSITSLSNTMTMRQQFLFLSSTLPYSSSWQPASSG